MKNTQSIGKNQMQGVIFVALLTVVALITIPLVQARTSTGYYPV